MRMVWSGKHPPIYCFNGDFWRRDSDCKLFEIDCEKGEFISDDEIIKFEKKQRIMRPKNERP